MAIFQCRLHHRVVGRSDGGGSLVTAAAPVRAGAVIDAAVQAGLAGRCGGGTSDGLI